MLRWNAIFDHDAKPIVSSVFACELPARDLLNHALMIVEPMLHLIETVIQGMNDIGEEELGQLAVTQAAPVSMSLPQGIDLLLDAHLTEPFQDEGNIVYPLDPLLHAAPVPSVLPPWHSTWERGCSALCATSRRHACIISNARVKMSEMRVTRSLRLRSISSNFKAAGLS
jgi:hypothetical protein